MPLPCSLSIQEGLHKYQQYSPPEKIKDGAQIIRKHQETGIMGLMTIVLIVMWASVVFEGIYGVVKGYFYREQEKAKKHEPVAYRKWVRLSGVFIAVCGVLNIIWSVLDSVSKAADFKYTIYIIITVVAVIAAAAVSYTRIVKPADKANGIESEFDKILKDNKQ